MGGLAAPLAAISRDAEKVVQVAPASPHFTPTQEALRFSRNAAMPSAASSERNTRALHSAVSAKASICLLIRLYSSRSPFIRLFIRLKMMGVLLCLNAAIQVSDMDVPGWRLHALKGDMKGVHAVDVSSHWRLTFRFEEGHAYVVNYEDYH